MRLIVLIVLILNPWKQNTREVVEEDYELVFELRPTNERHSKITIRSSKEDLELKHRIDKAIFEYLDETEKYEIRRKIIHSKTAVVRRLLEAIESIDFENYNFCRKRGYDGVTILIRKITGKDSKQISFWSPSRESCQEVYDVLDELFMILEKTSEYQVEYEQINTLKRNLDYKN